MNVRLKDHRVEIANITQGVAYTSNKRKESTDTDYKSALAEHVATLNHVTGWDDATVIEQVQNWKLLGIKEAIHIRTDLQSLNRPQGEKHVVPDVWDSLLGQQQQQEPRGCQLPHDQGSGGRLRGATN